MVPSLALWQAEGAHCRHIEVLKVRAVPKDSWRAVTSS
jgi:hypothetical protein